jgi:phenylacetate-CoA ligase
MDNWLSDGILRAIGFANRVRPYDWLDRLEVMQWWDEERMLAWQREQLGRVLGHAKRSVPYYREHLSTVALPGGTAELSVLDGLPVLTKELVREEFERLQIEGAKRKTQEISTSGSTGKPLHISVDNEAFGRYFAAKFRALRWYGVNFADRQLRVWGLMMAKDKRLYWKARDVLQNRLRLPSFDLSDETLERFWPRLRSFRPIYINGYTSAVQRLADFIEKTGKDGRSLGVKVVLPTAEMLYDWQREQMERVFGCPVMNEYGGSEVQAIAYQCSAGTMHPTHENMIVEVLDESGRPVPDGQEGLLTVTSLAATGMPMIRYQNGDLVAKRSGFRCACGRHPGLPVLERIVGRSTDVLLRADGQVTHWTTMYYAIKDAFVPGMVIEHQARQKAVDHLEILVVKGPIYSDAAMERFLGRMREVLGEKMRMDVVFVDEIPREKSGKRRYFVSELRDAQLRSAKS